MPCSFFVFFLISLFTKTYQKDFCLNVEVILYKYDIAVVPKVYSFIHMI